jgi:hypothetical protein
VDTSLPPTAAASLELWPDPRKVRRGRALGVFLLANWVAMGGLVLTNGLRSLTGGLAFAFGLLTLLGGVSQLRGARFARTTPLVRLGADRLEHRYYSGGELRVVELAQVTALLRSGREEIVLVQRDGEEVAIPCLALADADRARLEQALRARLA